MNFDMNEEDNGEETSICKIKFSRKPSSKPPLFLAEFSNSRPKTSRLRKIKYTCYRSSKDSDDRNARRILVANSKRMCYRGASFEPYSVDNDSTMQYFIGVRNKNSGKMKLYRSAFFQLTPASSQSVPEVTTDTATSYQESMDSLRAKFGSKKSQKAMASRLKLSSDSGISPIQNDGMDLIQETIESMQSVTENSTPQLDYVPPQNRGATDVAEVFSLYDIISPEELSALKSESKILRKAKPLDISMWKCEHKFCHYIIRHLENGNIGKHKAKYLMYLNYLIQFQKYGYDEMRKKEPAAAIPQPFRQSLLDRFTVVSTATTGKTSRTFPLRLKDKILAYTLVLVLFIDNFLVDISTIQPDLKAGIPKLTKMFQALGCHVSTKRIENISVKLAELRLPLFVLTQTSVKKKK